MSLETWKAIADWATIVFIALTVVSGSAALILGDRINEKQAEHLREFDGKLTEARTTLSKQEERAANAERDLSAVKKDLAEAKTREAQAEQELHRLKNPRSLSPEAIAILRNRPRGRAVIQCLIDIPETKMFASRLYGSLLGAGWDMSASPSVVPVKSFNVDVGLSDVFVLGQDINGMDDPTTPIGALREALKKSGYQSGAMRVNSGNNTLVILVSHRP